METGENQSLLNRRESRDCCIRCCRSCCVGCVCSKGILLLLTWSVLIHGFEYYTSFQIAASIATLDTSLTYYFYAVSVSQAVVFILYPVAGLLGEVCFSRQQIMIAGTILSLIGIVITVPTGTISIYFCDDCSTSSSSHYLLLFAVCFGIVIYHFGLGLFESNAIQFGTDQLQFASNEKLSVFVNWYFWSMYFIKTITLFPFFVFLPGMGVAVFGCLSFILISITLFCCCCGCHRNLTTEPVSHVNPVKHIFKVLNYARHHSQPVFRSAFTYGEVPSRLDLAKNRYGGPFTTEEVEDVKTFGRILLVLTSLFGFLLLPNNVWSLGTYFYFDYSVDNVYFGYFQYVNIQSILPVLLIPVHMLIIRPCFNRYTYRISILKKMGTGLVLVVMSLCLMMAVDVSLYKFILKFYSDTDDEDSPPKYIPILIIISQILNGLSLILISLSALEFILAQGPRSMQGLLIGLWYAYQSVSLLVQIPSQRLLYSEDFQYWLTVLKTCLAVVSLIVFIIISRWYKYRQREESSEINRQAIIEEYTERQLITDRESFDYDNEYNYLRNYSYRTVQ